MQCAEMLELVLESVSNLVLKLAICVECRRCCIAQHDVQYGCVHYLGPDTTFDKALLCCMV